MKKIRENKAITLVALVITIIILLILAGISVAQLTGNGLFEKAKLAKEVSKNAQDDENDKTAKYNNEIESYVGNTRNGLTYTVLFDAVNEGDTVLANVNDFRTLSNVSSYDFLLVYVGSKVYPNEKYPPKIVYKGDYRI